MTEKHPLGEQSSFPRSITGILEHRARVSPERLAYAFIHEGKAVDTLTYLALHEKACVIAAHLRASAANGPVLLSYPSGLEFIAAFFGCLYAGRIAVPLYPPGRKRLAPRIASIMADAQPGFGLTCESLLDHVLDFSAQEPAGRSLHWMATDALPAQPAAPVPQHSDGHNAIAYLQYTSGSTSTPKGVIVTHHSLLRTLDDLDRGWRHDAASVMVSWLPVFHDMGLIYGLLQPLHGGFPCYLMDPLTFLQRPLRWLEAMSRHGGTHSAAPNFAFDLCVRSIDEAEKATLDLSRWRVALNAAEPVRAATLEAFSSAFASCGFDSRVFCPGYGLAESTLKVAATRRDVGPTLLAVSASELARGRVEPANAQDEQVRTLVGCGVSEIGARIAIVDWQSGVECPANGIGEIWVGTESAGDGYWRRPDESRQTFDARLMPTGEGPFLRTGDLGFLYRGELFITGRLKDMIIVRGTNHYPQDIELTVELCHPSLIPGAGAAFSVEVDHDEKLVVAHELSRKALRGVDVDEVVQSIRAAVAREHDLAVHAVVLLRPASIPKTSSGKIQRSACKSAFESGTLSAVAQWREAMTPAASTAQAGAIRPWIIERVAVHAGIAANQVDEMAPFANLGIDSLTAVRLSDELGRWLGRSLSPTILFEYPTPSALARHLEQLSPNASASAFPDEDNMGPAEPIAVIGLGCRFPGGPDVETFWNSLAAGVDIVAPAPADRWSQGQASVPPGHWLDGIDRFDADFFGISPREAERMDPQQRLLLEVAYEALEDAGLADVAGSRTGVFVGISTNDYARLLLHPDAPADGYAGTGGALSIAANRLSYLMDLRGPSWAVDTACSSSLVAVHQASQALRLGECDVALAGGVNVIASPELTHSLVKARMLSPDGRCKAFDAAADGYGRGEGCGVVVLKRYRDALRDGDRVCALLLGSAVNQDGRSNGLTAPNGLAQQQVIRRALRHAGVAPADVSYVETHGTGTPLGDPIEVEALTAVLAEGRTAEQPCQLGSVKTAIGHLEAAAGIAGLVKTVLALEHEELPPHLHYRRPNPHLRLDGTPFSIATARCPWPRGARRRIAGISSFGFGGTNAHVIVAEAPAYASSASNPPADRDQHVLTLSAKTPAALAEQARRYSALLAKADATAFADLCYTTNVHRTHHRTRVALVADDIADLRRRLDSVESGDTPANRKLAMLFTGQGSQYRGMGADLYRTEPVFRRIVDDCDAMLGGRLCPSLRMAWLGDADGGLLHDTAYTQPALFVLEFAIAQLWRSWGVEPAALLGHSVGEYAAAAIADVFSCEDGLKLVAARGRLMQALPRDGLMAAVAADHEHVLQTLGADHPRVSVAAVNGPRNTVISGERASVEALIERFARAGVSATVLRTSHAFHSPLVEPMLDEFAAQVASIRMQPPSIPVISNLTGDVAGDDLTTPDYWRRHAREPVLFAAGMSALEQHGCSTFLEVGPAPVLLGMGRQSVANTDLAWLPTLRPGIADTRQMLESLGAWWARGGSVDWRAVHRDRSRRCVRLPTYPFQRQRHWLRDDWRVAAATGGRPPATGHPLPRSAVESDTVEYTATVQSLVQAQANVRRTVPIADFHALLRRHGIEIDERFHAVRQLWVDAGQALGEIVLPDTAQAFGGFRADLIVVDACLQLVAAACDSLSGAGRLHLQEGGIERFTLLAPLDSRVWGHVRLRQPIEPAEQQLIADLQIYGPAGDLLAMVDGLRLRLGAAADCIPAAADGADALLYRLEWPQRPLLVASHRPAAQSLQASPGEQHDARLSQQAAGGQWLIVADRGGVAEQLATRLSSQGDMTTLISPAALSLDAFRTEVQRACAQQVPLHGVVHLASLDTRLDDAPHAALHEAIETGCRSALALAQALIESPSGHAISLWLVTRGAVGTRGLQAPPPTPAGIAQAPVWGLGKVLATEHAGLRCRLVDLDPAGDDIVTPLLDELRHADVNDEPRVALHAGRRHVARLVRCGSTATRMAIHANRPYLITGGFGGIGLHMAQWLVSQGARQLVLVGRNGAASPAAAQAVRALQASGVTLLVEQADVSRRDTLEALLQRVAAELPPLAGVVHAAGVVDDRLVVDQRWPLFEKVFAPKVDGAWHLHSLTQHLPLDFFVLCSSASTLIGGAGLANYVAANEFLDALASYRTNAGLPALSVAWGPWASVGMARHVGGTREAEWRTIGARPLTPDEALHGFARALGHDGALVSVMQVDWKLFAAHRLGAVWARLVESLFSSSGTHEDARLTSERQRLRDAPPGERAQGLLQFVRAEVEAVLGWPAGEHISVRRGFFDLGMDSLQANELRNRLQVSLQCALPTTLAFRFPTTAALAAHLHEELFGAAEASPDSPRAIAPAPVCPANVQPATLQDELTQLEQVLGR